MNILQRRFKSHARFKFYSADSKLLISQKFPLYLTSECRFKFQQPRFKHHMARLEARRNRQKQGTIAGGEAWSLRIKRSWVQGMVKARRIYAYEFTPASLGVRVFVVRRSSFVKFQLNIPKSFLALKKFRPLTPALTPALAPAIFLAPVFCWNLHVRIYLYGGL